MNVFLGFAIMMWLVQPFLYWYNVYDARTFEFFGSDLFFSDGTPYDVSLVSPRVVRATASPRAYQRGPCTGAPLMRQRKPWAVARQAPRLCLVHDS